MFNRNADWWIDPPCDHSHECRECNEHSQKLDDAREFFDELTNMLYGTKPLNISHLEFCLDELGHYIGAKMKRREFMPNIERKVYITTREEIHHECAIAG